MMADFLPHIPPPQEWRVIGDQPEVELDAYIPTDRSERSRLITETVLSMSPAEMAEVAVRYLAEHHPDDPALHAYLDADSGE